jgi:toxin CcdB
MAQHDVYRNPSPRSRATLPYLLDVQADLLSRLTTRLVVPLARVGVGPKPIQTLNPTLYVEGEAVVLLTEQMASVHTRDLGEPVAKLQAERATIVAALDLIFTGF